MIRNLVIDGHIGKNGAEVKQTTGGVSYIRFSLASSIYSDGQETVWFDVTSFDKNVINLAQYLTKGKYIFVVGEFLKPEKSVKDNTVYVNLKIRASNVSFVPTGNSGQTQTADETVVSTYTGGTIPAPIAQPAPATPAPEPAPEPAPAVVTVNEDKDDLPF